MVVVAQLGARMHYAVPAILHRAGLLERLYTDIYAPPLPASVQKLASLYGPRAVRRWFGRVPPDIPREKIVSFPSMGFEYFRRQRSAKFPGDTIAAYLWGGKEFCRRIIPRGLGRAGCVYTYNSAGLELMQYARSQGARSIMEQTIAPLEIEEELLEAEQTAYPNWEHLCLKDPFRSILAQREKLERQTADAILCGSEFVRDSIRACGGPAERCFVVPYGVRLPHLVYARDGRHTPLRVLTIGSVGLRKGSPYMLTSARTLRKKAEFRVAGQLDVTPYARRLLSEHITLLGPVPRSEIRTQFAWADVFLLPTLCEGSATVCYEALSHGLPVITTPNAGSVVRDRVDGFIVPIRDPSAIADRIERLADNGDLWAEMSANARARAADYTLEKYGHRLLSVLREGRSIWN